MRFQVRSTQQPAAELDGTVWELHDTQGDSLAAVWPAFGFNCYRWQVAREDGSGELLYSAPDLFHQGSRPTRSGIPVLFPFPNRIRDGCFTWDGLTYRLPTNDPSGKNAIHGFACRVPWRVIGEGADDRSAWVTGEFWCSKDAGEAQSLWPADHRLRLTVRLLPATLRLEAIVDNPDRLPLPFGLGYHPYFLAPPEEAPTSWSQVCVPTRSYWELRDALPTGMRLPVDAARDLNRPRPLHELKLDDVLSQLGPAPAPPRNGLVLRGTFGRLQLWTSPAFRELVAFTPPHRQALCLEPYTCTTDAINLQQRDLDAGLLVLPPGERWSGVVELRVV
jgi:aldose 1-epimerase